MSNQSKHLNKDKRPTRVPIDGPRDILTVQDKDPNYHYTWQSDGYPGNLERFLKAGYEFVTDPTKVGDATVNKSTRLNGMGTAVTLSHGSTMYLMRVPQEWYEEDFEAAQDQINAREQAMRQPIEGGYGKTQIDFIKK